MYEVQVEIVEPEFLHRQVEGTQRVVILMVLHPQFGCDEQLLTFQSAVAYSVANLLLVAVRGGRVNHAVAYLKGVGHHALGVVCRYLVHPEAYCRHYYAVVKSCFFHLDKWFSLVLQRYCFCVVTLL